MRCWDASRRKCCRGAETVPNVKVVEQWIARLMVALMLIGLFAGGSQPSAAGLIPAPLDKFAHVGVFFAFTMFLQRGWQLPLAWVAAIALLVGMADELHQAFLPGRVGSVTDWLADVTGVALATAVWRWRRYGAIG